VIWAHIGRDPLPSNHIEEQLIGFKEDCTIIVVAHNIHQAIRLGSYVAHLHLGELTT
jgi:ABC-type phosphate transport system ATPase subunit